MFPSSILQIINMQIVLWMGCLNLLKHLPLRNVALFPSSSFSEPPSYLNIVHCFVEPFSQHDVGQFNLFDRISNPKRDQYLQDSTFRHSTLGSHFPTESLPKGHSHSHALFRSHRPQSFQNNASWDLTKSSIHISARYWMPQKKQTISTNGKQFSLVNRKIWKIINNSIGISLHDSKICFTEANDIYFKVIWSYSLLSWHELTYDTLIFVGPKRHQ